MKTKLIKEILIRNKRILLDYGKENIIYLDDNITDKEMKAINKYLYLEGFFDMFLNKPK